jgi:hypothetical protein
MADDCQSLCCCRIRIVLGKEGCTVLRIRHELLRWDNIAMRVDIDRSEVVVSEAGRSIALCAPLSEKLPQKGNY